MARSKAYLFRGVQIKWSCDPSRIQDATLPEAVFLQAARARAQFGLKTPDAIHLAAAQHHRCAALWTNDDRLAQAAHGVQQLLA